MDRLFSPDSRFMQAISRLADLMILNLVFLATSLPLVTLGASFTALYSVVFRIGTHREEGLLRTYFRAFRENFLPGTRALLAAGFIIAAAVADAVLFHAMTGVLRYLEFAFGILAAIAILGGGYVLPLVSQFANTTFATLKNALVLSIAYLPRSAAILILNALPFFLLLRYPMYFFATGFIWVSVYFAAAAYLASILLRRVFAPYMAEDAFAPETE